MKRSLVKEVDLLVEAFQFQHKLRINRAFIECLDAQLTTAFEQRTNLTVDRNLALTFDVPILDYEVGEVSHLSCYLYVRHEWIPIIIEWRTRSGRIIDMEAASVPCDDLLFFFSNLDVETIRRHYGKKVDHPFNIREYRFPLLIKNLERVVHITINVEAEESGQLQRLNQQLDQTVREYNEYLELHEEQEGSFAHYGQGTIRRKSLLYYIDNADEELLKKMLALLNTFANIKHVTIE